MGCALWLSFLCPLLQPHVAKLGEITGKTRVLYSESGEITGKTRVLPCWTFTWTDQLLRGQPRIRESHWLTYPKGVH